MVLTNAQIAAFLKTPVGGPYPVSLTINDNIQPKGRWSFPRIDVENVNPEKFDEDYKLKNISQVFRIHLYYRVGGSASDELVIIQQIQQIVLTTVLAQQLAGAKLFKQLNDWNMDQKTDPVRYYESILDITPLDIQSTTGQGTIGATMSMVIAGLTIQILSEDTDEGNDMIRVPDDSGLTDIIPLANIGNKFIEYEYVLATYNAIQALIAARAYVTAVVNEGSTPRTMTVLPVRQRSSVRYDGLKTTILELQIRSG